MSHQESEEENTADPPRLSSFEIRGLYGLHDFQIPIEHNRLVLVGENGIGKSTVVTMMYQFLTHQWSRLARYAFDEVAVVVKGERLSLTHDAIDAYAEDHRPDSKRYPRRFREYAMHLIEQLDLFASSSESQFDQAARRLASRMGISLRLAYSVLRETAGEAADATGPVAEVSTRLRELFDVPVLFLPTYRRIERDLTEILPHLLQDREELLRRRRAIRQGKLHSHIELVEFGMEDVARLIDRTMETLKESLRQSLDALTGEYLREVLRKEYHQVKATPLQDLSEPVLNSILGRIDERILPSRDKERLAHTIERIRGSRSLREDDAVIAHFLTKILQLHREQAKREQPVRSFADVCNKYLEHKQVVFDNAEFSLDIISDIRNEDSHEPSKIDLGVLSSGEKQIVSLFAHLFMSREAHYFVIIDEPELSLSVPWQQQFLPDVVNSEYCAGLVAVTHSPFIFENDLESYTHSLSEYIFVSS